MTKILAVPTTQWNDEYKSGRWDFIEERSIERLRSAIIAVFCHQSGNRCSLLDVGCGTGTLYDFLSPGLREGYFGVDISEQAIKKAKESRGLNGAVIDAHQFDPGRAFDILVFNEVLYYLDYRAILIKYSELLNPGGIVIISVFWLSGRAKRKLISQLWSFCHSLFAELENIEIRGKSAAREKRWQLKVLRKI